MASSVYYNGEILPREKARIPLSDRAIFFGDGIYDAALSVNGKIVWEDDHVERFFNNAKALSLEPKITEKELKEILHLMVEKSNFDTAFLYFQLSRNSESRVHSAVGTNKSNLLVTIENFTLQNPTKKLSLITYPDKRYGYCNLKTLNLLPSVLAATEAEKSGCDEAVFVREGVITECSRSNIFIVKNGCLKTHPTTEHILPGIARKKVINAAKKLGFEVFETAFTKEDLMLADEIMITSTTKLCLAANIIDEKKAGREKTPITESIYGELYKEIDEFSNI